MHYGRYGKDSEDLRLSGLTVGYPSLVRGYEPGSFTPDECTLASDQSLSCPPSTASSEVGCWSPMRSCECNCLGPGALFQAQCPSVETGLFYDAGIAWRSKEISRALGIPRRPVSSYGATMRFNVLDFLSGSSVMFMPTIAHKRDGGGSSPSFQVSDL